MSNSEELIKYIGNGIPSELAKDLIENFTKLKSEVMTRTLEKSSPGKFTETVVQVLQYLDSGKYDKSPKVDDYLKNLESRTTKLSDDLKIAVARVARASYTLRNKRSIAHKGGVDPNIYDLKYLFSASQWIMSEIINQTFIHDMDIAGRIIDFIQVPISAVVQDFGNKRLVLNSGTAEEELIMLLLHYFPSYVLTSQIYLDMNRRAKSTISNVLTSTYKKRLIEGNKQQGYILTSLGYQRANAIVQRDNCS